MRLDELGALVLTCNEAPNIERTLAALEWVPRILVLDSGSTDGTLEIAQRFSNVMLLSRPFDDFASQRNFGLERIGTEWTLSLDADHRVSPELATEIQALDPSTAAAWECRFRYLVWGHPLRASILPPRPVLLRTAACRYVADGHAEKLETSGRIGRLEGRVDHDDRKPLQRWLAAQQRYARQEAAKLRSEQQALGLADRLRRLNWVAPLAVFFYVLVVRGGLLDGRRGLFYAYQRMLAETLLALEQLEESGR